MTESPSAVAELDSAGQQHEQHKHPVTVHVNERPVQLPTNTDTGLEIKRAAIAQGVKIESDFILVEELGGDRTKNIGDSDVVHVTDRSRFLANSGDDNS